MEKFERCLKNEKGDVVCSCRGLLIDVLHCMAVCKQLGTDISVGTDLSDCRVGDSVRLMEHETEDQIRNILAFKQSRCAADGINKLSQSAIILPFRVL